MPISTAARQFSLFRLTDRTQTWRIIATSGIVDLSVIGLEPNMRRGDHSMSLLRLARCTVTVDCGAPVGQKAKRSRYVYPARGARSRSSRLRLNRRKNLPDDVDFRKLRSSFQCQADEAGSN
jgi:hypothetical protein